MTSNASWIKIKTCWHRIGTTNFFANIILLIHILGVGHPGIWSRDINFCGSVLGIDLHFRRKIRFLTPCLSDFYHVFCHVLHCLNISSHISSRNVWLSAVRFLKPPLIFAFRSTINTESVPQVSWRKIWSISDFIVIVIFAVTSRQHQKCHI